MKVYALTVKKTRKPICLSSYEDYLAWLSKKVHVGNVNYENTKGLHFHCIIQSEDVFQFEDLKMEKYGWSYKLVPIYNHTGWLRYITKDIKKGAYEQAQLQELHEEDPRTRSEIPDISPYDSEEPIEIYTQQNPVFSIPQELYSQGFDIRNI